MNYVQLAQAIQDYSENTEQLFVANIPRFVQEAEDRIYNTVQLASLRKNVTGTMTINNKYISLPDDWLANYSLAVIDTDGNYEYLLNKDVNFLRQSYPNPNDAGLPKYYALFGSQYSNQNELSLIVAPTPDNSYNVELHYFYYPESIVQGQVLQLTNLNAGTLYIDGTYSNVPLSGGSGSGITVTMTVFLNSVQSVVIDNPGSMYIAGDVLTVDPSYIGGSGTSFSITVLNISNASGTSWLGDNYDPVLFYGAMREAVIFMKGEQDMVTYYENMFQNAIEQIKRLGDGLDRGDAYRDGQTKLMVKT